MNKLIFLSIFILISINKISLAENSNCTEYKKISIEYLKCKGNLVKEKTISVGQNIVEDTKEFQNKEWSKEKEKLIKTKEKITKTKEKILN